MPAQSARVLPQEQRSAKRNYFRHGVRAWILEIESRLRIVGEGITRQRSEQSGICVPRANSACDEAFAMTGEQTTRVRWFLVFWLFVLSAVSYLDRVNFSIAERSDR